MKSSEGAKREKGTSVLGVGVFLPEERRTNDWWPARSVEKWDDWLASFLPKVLDTVEEETEGVRRTIAAIKALSNDVFCGSVERRVAPKDMCSSDMEAKAALDALERTGLRAEQVDMVMTSTLVPDHLASNPAAATHAKIGLDSRCMALSVDSVCNSFVSQMQMATALIRTGQIEHALLIQSALQSRIVPYERPYSAWLGDGATCVVLGPGQPEQGLLSCCTRTDGQLNAAFVLGTDDGSWLEASRPIACSRDPRAARTMMLKAVDYGGEVLMEALSEAGVSRSEVGFFASHQPNPWLRRVVQEYAAFEGVPSVDTFPFAASLGAANIPLQLSVGLSEGVLGEGSLVAGFTFGSGMTAAGFLMRW